MAAKKAAAKQMTTAPKKTIAKEKKPVENLKRKRITDEPVMGEIVEFRGAIGWIKLSETVDEIDEPDKDLFCLKKDLAEGTSTKKGTDVTCHVYKDAKGFGAEEVSEA